MGKLAALLMPVLAIALIGTGLWGYQEHQEKNAILIKAENQYQQAFHDLAFYMDTLHEELGKSLALNSRKQIGQCLTNVWRLAYAAQSNVGQLPLVLLPFNKTEEFLSKIGDFSYRVALRDLDKEPLSQQEYKTLQELYRRSGEIQKELRNIQDQIFAKQLRWMDVETALATEEKTMDNSIIDGLKLIDERVESYSDFDFGMVAQNSEEMRLKKLQNLKGKEISEAEARKIALAFIGARDGENVKITANGDKALFGAYDITVHNPENESHTMVEVTKKGGHVLWMLNTREIKGERISIEQALTKATRYLRAKKYNGIEVAKVEKYDDTGVFTFVNTDDGIRIYPDSIVVKVALDNGEVVGFDASEYVANHTDRTFHQPRLSLEEARKRVNPNLKVDENHLAVIMNDLNEEVLCYEFTGTINDNYYRIYINAQNGDEEKVEQLHLVDGEKI